MKGCWRGRGRTCPPNEERRRLRAQRGKGREVHAKDIQEYRLPEGDGGLDIKENEASWIQHFQFAQWINDDPIP